MDLLILVLLCACASRYRGGVLKGGVEKLMIEFRNSFEIALAFRYPIAHRQILMRFIVAWRIPTGGNTEGRKINHMKTISVFVVWGCFCDVRGRGV